MARNEQLEKRIREAMVGVPGVEEKHMFRGTAFMVNGKLCVSAGDEELMFRFDPPLHQQLLQQQGCREMLRNGKPIKEYLYVHTSRLQKQTDLDRWVTLALDFNGKAKASKKKAVK